MSGAVRLIALADLHMSAGSRDAFREDAALVALLDALRERLDGDPARTSLLLLGDTFDFARIELAGRRGRRLDVSCEAALEKLELAAREHADVLAAFGRLMGSGVRIEIVPGNHDLELCHPAVRERLRSLLLRAAGPRASAEPRLHRWIFHLPGLVYAEHGHQHHDLNRTPGLLHVGEGAEPPVPFGNQIGEWLLEVPGARGRAVRALPATLRLIAAAARAPRAAAARELPAELEACARSSGLPAGVPALIDARAATPPAALARRFMGVAASRRAAPDLYMREAAGRVARVLVEAAAAVPFYLFAHTHLAADAPLAGGGRYLNTGTWSTLGTRPGGELTFVELAHLPGEPPEARLMKWNRAASEACPVAGRRRAEPVAA